MTLTCTSRSPFTTSPAHFAVQEPCRYMGTLHRESRVRIEKLRLCDAIDDDEWLCMARALQAIDRDFTARCRSDRVAYAEIADAQRAKYHTCAVAADRETIECTVLTANPACIASCCAPKAG